MSKGAFKMESKREDFELNLNNLIEGTKMKVRV